MAMLALMPACGHAPDSQQAEVPRTSPHATATALQDTAASLPLRLLADANGARKFVLIGEMHGTREIPALVAEFVEHVARRHGSRGQQPIILALEIASGDQPDVDRYMDSNGTPADKAALLAGSHWQDAMHDGRDSRAMFDLIERMRQLSHAGNDVSIDLFDEAGEGTRDKRMADHLRKVVRDSPGATVLVLAGNVHAMTAEPPWKVFDGGKQIKLPMTVGRYLVDLHPLSINIDAAGGEAWSCMGRECKPHAMPTRRSPPVATLEFHGASESAWDATLTLPVFTASLPALDGNTGWRNTTGRRQGRSQ